MRARFSFNLQAMCSANHAASESTFYGLKMFHSEPTGHQSTNLKNEPMPTLKKPSYSILKSVQTTRNCKSTLLKDRNDSTQPTVPFTQRHHNM